MIIRDYTQTIATESWRNQPELRASFWRCYIWCQDFLRASLRRAIFVHTNWAPWRRGGIICISTYYLTFKHFRFVANCAFCNMCVVRRYTIYSMNVSSEFTKIVPTDLSVTLFPLSVRLLALKWRLTLNENRKKLYFSLASEGLRKKGDEADLALRAAAVVCVLVLLVKAVQNLAIDGGQIR